MMIPRLKVKKILWSCCVGVFVLPLLFLPIIAQANPIKEKFEAATIAYVNGQYQTAIKGYTDILDVVPEFPQAQYYLALSYRANGESVSKVMDAFQKAADMAPDYAEPRVELAKAYYSLGKFDESINYAKGVLRADPASPVAKLILGWSYLLGKTDPGEAIGYFQDVVEGSQEDIPYAMFGLGMAYYMNQENHKTFDLITQLKKTGHDKFATQLEDVVRKGKFDLSAGAPEFLFPPLRQKQMQIEHQVEQMRQMQEKVQDKKSYKVRLRRDYSFDEGDALDEEMISDMPDPASNRIQMLQQKSQDLDLDL